MFIFVLCINARIGKTTPRNEKSLHLLTEICGFEITHLVF